LEAVIYPIIVNTISEIGNEIPSRKLWELVIDNIDGQLDEKNPNVFHSTDFGKLYINKITQISTDKFGAEKKHGVKNNSILIFNVENFAKMAKVYGGTKGIQTKLVEMNCDAPDALDASWKDAEPFYMINKNDKLKTVDDSGSKLDAIVKNQEIKTIQKKPSRHVNASNASNASCDEYPPNCYYCKEVFNGIGKQDYERHVLQKHPKKPCYPGLADFVKYRLERQGMSWEV